MLRVDVERWCHVGTDEMRLFSKPDHSGPRKVSAESGAFQKETNGFGVLGAYLLRHNYFYCLNCLCLLCMCFFIG